MSSEIYETEEGLGEDHGKLTLMELLLGILFGGIFMGLFGAAARGRVHLPKAKRKPLLTVEEAVRMLPE